MVETIDGVRSTSPTKARGAADYLSLLKGAESEGILTDEDGSSQQFTFTFDEAKYRAQRPHEAALLVGMFRQENEPVFLQTFLDGPKDLYEWVEWTDREGRPGKPYPVARLLLPDGRLMKYRGNQQGTYNQAQLQSGIFRLENQARLCVAWTLNVLADGTRTRTKDDVARITGTVLDLDGQPLPMEGFPAIPSAIVESSPGRFHVYWAVDGISIEEFPYIQRFLADRYQGDPSIKDVSRAMRLPGFWHGKREESFLCRLVDFNQEQRYTRETFVHAFPGLSQALLAVEQEKLEAERDHQRRREAAAGLRQQLTAGQLHAMATARNSWASAALNGNIDELKAVEEGGRNSAVNRVAFRLGRFVGAGLLDEALVKAEILEAGLHTGLRQDEVIGAMSSGLKDGKKRALTEADLIGVGRRQNVSLQPEVGQLVSLPEQAAAVTAISGPVVLIPDTDCFAQVKAALSLPDSNGMQARQKLTMEDLRTMVKDGHPVFAVTPSESTQRALDASGVEWHALPALALTDDPEGDRMHLDDALIGAFSSAMMGSLDFLQNGFLQQADARLKRGAASYPTGLTEFDEAIGGGFYDGLHVLGGVTGGGKTALALAIAESNARAGRPVIYVTYEQSRYELWGRLISTQAGVGLRSLRTGGTEQSPISEQLRNSAPYQNLTAEVAPYLDVIEGDCFDGGSWGVERIAAHVRRVKAAHGIAPLVILDYLQRMPSGSDKDRRHQIDDVVMGLQVKLGRELHTPVLLISSVGRGKYGELVSAPLEERLSVFKESGGVEYTAYTASLLYPLGVQNVLQMKLETPPLPGSGRAALRGLWKYLVLDLVKNREGEAPQQWVVRWYPASGRFDVVQPVDPEMLESSVPRSGGKRQ